MRPKCSFCAGFRDEAVYRGRQIFLYKRAQIVVADWWAAFGRQTTTQAAVDEADKDASASSPPISPFALYDVDRLTMFADYRVPQLLRPHGVLVYSDDLTRRIDNCEEIAAGSEVEIELRAATVQAVERLRAVLNEKHSVTRTSVEIDWWLWQHGEEEKDSLPPHHRTLTCWY